MPARSRKSAARRKQRYAQAPQAVGNEALHRATIDRGLSGAAGVHADARLARQRTRATSAASAIHDSVD